MSTRVLVASCGLVAAYTGSCGGAHPSKVEDCQNVDYGSCGGACCELDFLTYRYKPQYSPDYTIVELVQHLNGTLHGGHGGGPDHAYAPQMTAEGTSGFGSLVPLGSPMGVHYIGQTFHTTVGGYTDTINFNIRTLPSGQLMIRAHSRSQIGGAFADNGQNYKNIVGLMQDAFGSGSFGNIGSSFVMSAHSSCLPPAVEVQV